MPGLRLAIVAPSGLTSITAISVCAGAGQANPLQAVHYGLLPRPRSCQSWTDTDFSLSSAHRGSTTPTTPPATPRRPRPPTALGCRQPPGRRPRRWSGRGAGRRTGRDGHRQLPRPSIPSGSASHPRPRCAPSPGTPERILDIPIKIWMHLSLDAEPAGTNDAGIPDLLGWATRTPSPWPESSCC